MDLNFHSLETVCFCEELIILIVIMMFTDKFHPICRLQAHPVLPSVLNGVTATFCLWKLA